MNIYDREIIRAYNSLKATAFSYYSNGEYEKCLYLIDKLCLLANQLNWYYHDNDISELVDKLSDQFLKQTNKFEAIKGRVVFYDQYGKSFILALQYIYALHNAGYEIMYVLSDYVPANYYITEELSKLPNCTIKTISQKSSIVERAKQIYDFTAEFSPEKVFLHVKAFSSFNLVVPQIPSTAKLYYIDLQDHAFWVKNTNIDYVIPYRNWGATIDIEKRGFELHQVLLVPYYPIIANTTFKGFPIETKDKVVIFTGGEYYKTISTTNKYWNLIVKVLDDNPNAIVLFATKADTRNVYSTIIAKYGESNNIQDRLIPIGFRDDINEVFANCDIFFGTTPMSGGLMTQYAAYNSKPILQYYLPELSANNETEQVLNYNSHVEISYTNEEDFLNEANKLIANKDYREKCGKAIHDSLITKEQFDVLLKNTIEENKSIVPIEMISINYDAFIDWWFYLEKVGISQARKYLMSLIGRKKYILMPLSTLMSMLKRVLGRDK